MAGIENIVRNVIAIKNQETRTTKAIPIPVPSIWMALADTPLSLAAVEAAVEAVFVV